MADNFVKGIVYETNYWTEDFTNKAFTKCLKCGELNYLDENHTKCPKCGEEFGDYHNEFIDADTVEKLAWSYLGNISNKVEKSIDLVNSTVKIMRGESVELTKLMSDIDAISKHHLGFSHKEFSKDFGYPVESEVERGTVVFNGIEYPDNVWKCGFIVNDEIFELIQKGEINSFSFGGKAGREVLFETA